MIVFLFSITWIEGTKFRPFFLKRYERLEDQLNDLTDLHQHETANLKQELASIEEKVAYQAYERSRDVQVLFYAYQTSNVFCRSCIVKHFHHSTSLYTKLWGKLKTMFSILRWNLGTFPLVIQSPLVTIDPEFYLLELRIQYRQTCGWRMDGVVLISWTKGGRNQVYWRCLNTNLLLRLSPICSRITWPCL